MRYQRTILIFLAILLLLVFRGTAHCSKDTFTVEHWLTELQKRTQAKPGKSSSGQPLLSAKHNAKETNETRKISRRKDQKRIQKISVDFYKIDLHNVFRLLGQVSGKNIVVDESVKGTLTLALKDVPWTFVLDVIKSLKGLSSIERQNTIMIFPSSKEVEWGASKVLEGEGALEVNEAPEPKGPAMKKEAGLVVKGRQPFKVSFDIIEKVQAILKKAKKKEESGDINGALSLYQKASDMWPDNAALAKKVAAMALGRTNEELMAFNYAKQALRVNQSDSEAASLAAVALARMGMSQKAVKFFERAVSSPDVDYETLYNYAVFTFSNGLYRETLRLLNRIEANFPVTADCLLLKARAYEALNYMDQAISAYTAVLNGGDSISFNAKEFARTRLKEIAKRVDRTHTGK